MKRTIIIFVFLCLHVWTHAAESIDLSGLWRFQLDPLGFGKTPGSELYLDKLVETILLSGSTDEAGKSVKNNARYVDRLSRKFEYQGAAWYQREVVIPESWRGKHIVLHLERCHWETTVYVDGELAGTDERLSTPNRFDLSRMLPPGLHTLTICVDNRLKYPIPRIVCAHCPVGPFTQTGLRSLRATPGQNGHLPLWTVPHPGTTAAMATGGFRRKAVGKRTVVG